MSGSWHKVFPLYKLSVSDLAIMCDDLYPEQFDIEVTHYNYLAVLGQFGGQIGRGLMQFAHKPEAPCITTHH